MDEQPLSEKEWKALPENKGKRYKVYRKAFFKEKHKESKPESKPEVENVGIVEQVVQKVTEASPTLAAAIAPPKAPERIDVQTMAVAFREAKASMKQRKIRLLDVLQTQPPEIYQEAYSIFLMEKEAEKITESVFSAFEQETKYARSVIDLKGKLDAQVESNKAENGKLHAKAAEAI